MLILVIPLTIVLLTPLMSILSSSWLIIWSMLEMNTMSFVSIKSFFPMESLKLKIKSSLKYFMIQSMSSAMILSTVLYATPSDLVNLINMIILTSLMVKIASPPFHRWFTEIIKFFMKTQVILLMTWQKMIPIFILSVLITKGKFLFIILGATFSCVLISQTGSVLMILAFSSMFNNSWIISCTSMSLHTLILFIVLYWSAVIFLTTEMFKKMSTTEMNNNKKSLSLLLVVNLSGLPPSTGFLSKWIVSIKMLKFEWFFTLLLIISLSIYNTFSYLRMSSVVIMVFKNWPSLKPMMSLKGVTFLSLYLLPFLI